MALAITRNWQYCQGVSAGFGGLAPHPCGQGWELQLLAQKGSDFTVTSASSLSSRATLALSPAELGIELESLDARGTIDDT
jgi:hypothetical protein